MKHEEITQMVIGCALEVINEFGAGFLESVYEKRLTRNIGKQDGTDQKQTGRST